MALITEKTDLDNILIDMNYVSDLDSNMGQAILNPAQYTVLDRLKQIETNTTGIGTNNFTTTNSTNVDLSKADLDSIVVSTGIHNFTTTNSTNTDLSKADLDSIVTNTSVNNDKKLFQAIVSITRPANTTAYSIGDIINNNGASSMPHFDLSSISGIANKIVEVNEVQILSNSQNLTMPMWLFESDTIGSITLTDNSPFVPTVTDLDGNGGLLGQFSIALGALGVMASLNNLTNKTKLDSNSFLYFVLGTNTVFTPTSGEVFKLGIKGNYY